MEITDEQLHHDVIVHAQAFLSLAHHPISHGSAERPWKLTTTFTSGAEHVTYHGPRTRLRRPWTLLSSSSRGHKLTWQAAGLKWC